MKPQAHFNPKSVKWIISFVIMLVLSAGVIVGTIALNDYNTKKNNEAVEIDMVINKTTPIALEENELGVTGIKKALNSSGDIVAYEVSLETVGYNQESPIEMTATITADGSVVCGIDILKQEETEYLGVRIMDDSFQDQFDGKKLPLKGANSIELGTGVDLIANSTISSQAVLDAVNNAQEYVLTYVAD